MIVGQASKDLLKRIENAIDHVRGEYDEVTFSEILGTLRQASRFVEDEWMAGDVDEDGEADDEKDEPEAWRGN